MSSSRRRFDVCEDKHRDRILRGDGMDRQDSLDHEIVQLTRVCSSPHPGLCRARPGKVNLPVLPVKMLGGREVNYNGRGRFTSAECCHILSRYLPVYGPSVVDKMRSCAYVSQFSADGSLFVAGFQVWFYCCISLTKSNI